MDTVKEKAMKFTDKKVYQIDFYGDDYWMHQALEEALPVTDSVTLDNIKFMSRGVAIEAAKAALLKYVELTPGVGELLFNSTADSQEALDAVGAPASDAVTEGRYAGAPRIDVAESGGVTLFRGTEVRLVGRKKVVKTVLVDGETYTKETVEEASSPWFPGVTETVTLWVSGSQVFFIEE